MKRCIIGLNIIIMVILTGCGNSSQDKPADNHTYMEYQETTLYEKKIKDGDIVDFWVDSKGVPYVMLCKITYGKDNYNEVYSASYSNEEDVSVAPDAETMGDRNYNYVIYKVENGELERVYEFDDREQGSYSRTIEYADLQSVYDVMAVDENDNLYIINDEGIARLAKDGDVWEMIYEDGMHLNSNFFVTEEMVVRNDVIYIYGYFKEDSKYAIYSYSLQEAKQ